MSTESLFNAIREGNLESTRSLLDSRADILAIQTDSKDGTNFPLILAARYERDNIVGLLLERKANVNMTVPTGKEEGSTALHVASVKGNIKIMNLLINAGVDINTRSKAGDSAVSLATLKNRNEAVLLLVSKGAALTHVDRFGDTVLMDAASTGNYELCQTFLEKAPDMIKHSNVKKETPLHKATNSPRAAVETTTVLLRFRPDVNAKREDGRTPLHVAVSKRNAALVSLLLEHKADPSIQDKTGNEPIKYAQHESIRELLTSALTATRSASPTPASPTSPRPVVGSPGGRKEGSAMAEVQSLLNELAIPLKVGNGDDFVRAGQIGNLDFLQKALSSGMNINVQDEVRKETALLRASREGHKDVVSFLLGRGANVNLTSSVDSSPVLAASLRGYNEIVSLLIEKKANVNQKNKEGDSPISLAVWKNHTTTACLLVDAGASINNVDKFGDTVLLDAAKSGNLVLVKKFLEAKMSVGHANKEGMTAFHYAAVKGSIECLEVLLKYGAKIDVQTKRGATALHLAAEKDLLPVVRWLVDNGADCSICDTNGNIALSFARSQGVKEVLESNTAAEFVQIQQARKQEEIAFIELCSRGSLEGITTAMKRGIDLNCKNGKGDTPLIVASRAGHISVVQLLVENHANVNDRNTDGSSALMASSMRGHNSCVEYLLSNGAKINQKTDAHDSATSLAVWKNQTDTILLLVDSGAEVTQVDRFGDTMLLDSAKAGNLQIVNIMLEKGLSVNHANKAGETPLTRVCQFSGSPDVLAVLIDAGAHLDKQTNSNQQDGGRTALHFAAIGAQLGGDSNACLNLLIAHRADVNIRDVNGRTALHYAARSDAAERVLSLLSAPGIVRDFKDKDGKTALQLAGPRTKHLLRDQSTDMKKPKDQPPIDAIFTEGNHVVLKFTGSGMTDGYLTTSLKKKYPWEGGKYEAESEFVVRVENSTFRRIRLEEGGPYGYCLAWIRADERFDTRRPTDDQTLIEVTPKERGVYEFKFIGPTDKIWEFQVFVLNPDDWGGVRVTEFLEDVENRDLAEVRNKLSDKEFKVNSPQRFTNLTAVSICARNGFYEILALLISHRADVNIASNKRQFPLSLAAEGGHVECVRLLLEARAGTEYVNYQSETALHLAVIRNQPACVDLLLRYGADPEAKNRQRQTPLALATKLCHSRIVELLLDRGVELAFWHLPEDELKLQESKEEQEKKEKEKQQQQQQLAAQQQRLRRQSLRRGAPTQSKSAASAAKPTQEFSDLMSTLSQRDAALIQSKAPATQAKAPKTGGRPGQKADLGALLAWATDD